MKSLNPCQPNLISETDEKTVFQQKAARQRENMSQTKRNIFN